ncbi:MAG: Hsp20/alpha crystallin family protein [Candidatus Magasanikbacteria bacterium]
MSKKNSNNPSFSLELETEQENGSYFQKTQEPPEWHNSPEGELAVDVLANDEFLIIVSTMAGAAVDKVNVNIHNDLLTIRGERRLPLKKKRKLETYHQECYWGPFSRTIVLPAEIQAEKAYAEYENGILKVFIPKKDSDRDVPINIIEG